MLTPSDPHDVDGTFIGPIPDDMAVDVNTYVAAPGSLYEGTISQQAHSNASVPGLSHSLRAHSLSQRTVQAATVPKSIASPAVECMP